MCIAAAEVPQADSSSTTTSPAGEFWALVGIGGRPSRVNLMKKRALETHLVTLRYRKPYNPQLEAPPKFGSIPEKFGF